MVPARDRPEESSVDVLGEFMGIIKRGAAAPGRRRRSPAGLIRIVAVVVAVLLVSVITLQRSQSAFSGTTSYGDADVMQAATVKLSSAATGRLDVQNMVPGDSITRCVNVTYDGTATAQQLDSVRLFAADRSGDALGDSLGLTVDMGAVGDTCQSLGATTAVVPSQTVSALSGAHGTYASAIDSGWTPSATGQTRPFRFTLTLSDTTPNELQGASAKLLFTWEVHTAPGTSR